MNNAVPVLVGVAIAILVGFRLLRFLHRPTERSFRCAKCSTPAVHSRRTINAWRIGKRKFFCNTCHVQWLESRPTQGPTSRAESKGCLGIIIVAVAAPLIGYLVVKALI